MKEIDKTLGQIVYVLLENNLKTLDEKISLDINRWLLLKIHELVNSEEYENLSSIKKIERQLSEDIFKCPFDKLKETTKEGINALATCAKVFDPNLELFASMYGFISIDELEDNIWTYYQSLC